MEEPTPLGVITQVLIIVKEAQVYAVDKLSILQFWYY